MEELNNVETTVSIDLSNFKSLIGWATFRAIMDIIVGALSCLGLITAAYGIPQIIGGVRLLSACDELKSYLATNNIQKINESFASMNKHFKLAGIATIVKIIFGIIFFVIYIFAIAYFIKNAANNPNFGKLFPRG